ncbi:BRAP2-domain-containing protein [Linderina pennispora]|uniref:BRAP2-domain-containing protein n=1 Tax=Linderina pennispora TaxID=61395 RepID=A0A1Y1VZF7_9FUNG|nr:BRAP2-domain-containing protein [Linderina pennispora]ORX66622.1 BRAP2-domain-containing protein [Linderina pennispora]
MYVYKLYVGLTNVVTAQPKTKRINIFQQSLAGDLQHLSTLKKHRRPDYRFGRIQLEWFRIQKDSSMQGVQTGLSAVFEASGSSSHGSSTPVSTRANRPRVLAVLAVPGYMTPTDFLSFVAPFQSRIEHLRVLRDRSPNHYMILIRLTAAADADEFYMYYNGKTFSPLEPENCHVVYISQVECEYAEIALQSNLFMHPKWDVDDINELPTCPRQGLLTIMCQHTFHCRCLAKWGDGNCPVCRYSQTSPFVDQERFQQAVGSFPQIRLADRSHTPGGGGDLWICLICGTIGCGRYVNGHAKDHFSQTQHPYSMELESQRVWDYVGDGYVHRLLQNKADGKLVELSAPAHTRMAVPQAGTSRLNRSTPPDSKTSQQVPSCPSDVYFEAREKLDAVTEEYEILLTSQLESQREHYEIQLARQQHQNARWPKQYADLERKFAELETKYTGLAAAQDLSTRIQFRRDLGKQRDRAESERREWAEERKRLEKSTDDARLLAEEKALSQHLIANQAKLNETIAQMNHSMDDLKEQEKISASGSSLQGASVVGVAEAPAKSKGKRRIPRK